MSLERERSSDDPILKKQMDLKKLNADNSVFHMMRSENMQLNLDLSWLARSTDVESSAKRRVGTGSADAGPDGKRAG